jgi:hypothetical protein
MKFQYNRVSFLWMLLSYHVHNFIGDAKRLHTFLVHKSVFGIFFFQFNIYALEQLSCKTHIILDSDVDEMCNSLYDNLAAGQN